MLGFVQNETLPSPISNSQSFTVTAYIRKSGKKKKKKRKYKYLKNADDFL